MMKVIHVPKKEWKESQNTLTIYIYIICILLPQYYH